jgi:NAD(P)-dependent dehydrogenase (short-subunit alcohol dehydrogenase family)
MAVFSSLQAESTGKSRLNSSISLLRAMRYACRRKIITQVYMTPLLHQLTRPANVLIMGASSGIGLALAEQLAADTRVALVFVAARGVTRSAAIDALSKKFPSRVLPFDTDIASEQQLDQLQQFVRLKSPVLHLVVNTAGLLHAKNLQPEKALSQLTMESLQQSFMVNAFGPALLAKAMLPMLRHDEPAVFASVSARVGSITDNRLGGWYGYRAAKAAQNQLLKTFAIEFGRLNRQGIVLVLHPGTTDTALSEPFQGNVPASALFSPERAARQLLAVIAQCTPADSGSFLAWDGQRIAW